MNLSAYIT